MITPRILLAYDKMLDALIAALALCLLPAAAYSTSIEMPQEVNLGVLSAGIESIELTVPIHNKDLTNDVYITQVEGACTCFKHAKYEALIKPNASNDIAMTFDLGKFVQSGEWDTKIAVESRDKLGKSLFVIHVDAKFLLVDRVLVVPPSKSVVADIDSGRLDLETISVFVPSIYAQDTKIALGQLPKTVYGKIVTPVNESKRIGDFTEVARISISLSGEANIGQANRYTFPIVITGAIYKNYIYNIDLYKLN